MAAWIVYDRLDADEDCRETAELLEVVVEDEETHLLAIEKIVNYAVFFSGLAPEDCLILVGNDGTLHRFVEETRSLPLPERLLYYPCGTGCGLARGLGRDPYATPSPVRELLRPLPTVEWQGREEAFVCTVGAGLSDHGRRSSRSGRFRPVGAEVTVDGVSHSFGRTWLVQGARSVDWGGVGQEGAAALTTLTVLHGAGRLTALRLLPAVLAGRRMKCRRHAAVLTGREITVRFDRPVPLQIDGEPGPEVREYTIRTAQTPAQH